MSKIKIKNFGPIKNGFQENDGWLDVKKVTIFVGNQGSGKSTVAKVISTLSWLEKAINRGDTAKNIPIAFFREFFEYHKILSYFSKKTYIEYIGDKYHILCDTSQKDPIVIREIKDNNYVVPKIMYIPAGRNFLSTISDAFNIKGLPDNIFSFAEELKRAQKELKGEEIPLPISDITYQYDDEEDRSFVLGADYKLSLLEASSGLQSFIPLYLVSRNLSMSITDDEKTLRKNLNVTQSIRMDKEIADLMLDKSVTESLDQFKEIEKIRARYYNKCFLNIVEEPEQNLFPSSQWDMLKSLLKLNNKHEGNKLIVTTHSPYLINYLTLCVKADKIFNLLKEKKYQLSDPEFSLTNEIVPWESVINSNDLAIYEMNEEEGSIKMLSDFEGIPSDNNFLNNSLGKTNQLYDQLLEIEEDI